MYVFGGWIPLTESNKHGVSGTKWICSGSSSVLNLGQYFLTPLLVLLWLSKGQKVYSNFPAVINTKNPENWEHFMRKLEMIKTQTFSLHFFLFKKSCKCIKSVFYFSQDYAEISSAPFIPIERFQH